MEPIAPAHWDRFRKGQTAKGGTSNSSKATSTFLAGVLRPGWTCLDDTKTLDIHDPHLPPRYSHTHTPTSRAPPRPQPAPPQLCLSFVYRFLPRAEALHPLCRIPSFAILETAHRNNDDLSTAEAPIELHFVYLDSPSFSAPLRHSQWQQQEHQPTTAMMA